MLLRSISRPQQLRKSKEDRTSLWKDKKTSQEELYVQQL